MYQQCRSCLREFSNWTFSIGDPVVKQQVNKTIIYLTQVTVSYDATMPARIESGMQKNKTSKNNNKKMKQSRTASLSTGIMSRAKRPSHPKITISKRVRLTRRSRHCRRPYRL